MTTMSDNHLARALELRKQLDAASAEVRRLKRAVEESERLFVDAIIAERRHAFDGAVAAAEEEGE